MTEELSGRRIVVPETRELGQLVRMLEERGADTVPCPMIAIRDAPDTAPVKAWLRRFAKGTCDDLVLMTGEGLRRLLGFARRIDLESAFIDALRLTRKITRGPKPVRALREVGLAADVPADQPTTEGVIAALERHDLTGRRVGVQLYPGNANARLLKFLESAGARSPSQARPRFDGSAMLHAPSVEKRSCDKDSNASSLRLSGPLLPPSSKRWGCR